MAKKTLIAVSGGFDPPHDGHVDYLRAAAAYGSVIVLLNSDEWLKRKKGYVFLSWEKRKKILMEMKSVADVYRATDDDDTVCASLRMWPKFKYFGKGGDRVQENTPELEICKELGIEVIFGLGGEKTNSSSELINRAKAH